jgi:hypothetical protein
VVDTQTHHGFGEGISTVKEAQEAPETHRGTVAEERCDEEEREIEE